MPELIDIESQTFSARDFRLESGKTLPILELAYETYGSLSAAGDNAILVVHGYTSSHHAAGRNAAGRQGRGVTEGSAGWFDGLIGPGKPIDTDRYFVVSVNALGSAHGSSGPNSIDPGTGKPYGPTFPHITLRDMVASQKLLVDSLPFRLNFEFNVEAYSRDLARQCQQYMDRWRNKARKVTRKSLRAEPVGIRLRNAFVKLFSPFL